MSFLQLQATFNEISDNHKMHNWDHNRRDRDAIETILVAKLFIAENYERDREAFTWLPYDVNSLTKEKFASILYKFVSAYPPHTHLYFSGSDQIDSKTSFLVFWNKK